MAGIQNGPVGVTAIGTVRQVQSNGVLMSWGDGGTDNKVYRILASYSPAEGDRALAVSMSGSYLIIGKIK